MTPAINQLENAGVEFDLVTYDPGDSSRQSDQGYGLTAAEQTGADPDQVFKTLIVTVDGAGKSTARASGARGRTHAVAIIPASTMLSLKNMGKALGVKRVAMCDPTAAERLTGYVVGGISPFGQRQQLLTVIDEQANRFDRVYVSGGQRGLEILVAPAVLVAVLDATVAPITT